jgi:hypothetical protein
VEGNGGGREGSALIPQEPPILLKTICCPASNTNEVPE